MNNATSEYQTSFVKPNGIYVRKCPPYGTSLFSVSRSPADWPSCQDAYDYTWKNDPDNEVPRLTLTNRLKLAHSMGFCPHLRCQLGNLSSPLDARRGQCSKGLCYTKLENGSPSFGACCFVNGSFDSGDLIGFYDKCQQTPKPIYKHSRIVLQIPEGDDFDRFVNANRIHPQIIATQCPMKRTLTDVKHLIQQEKISLWIQLTAHNQLSPKHDCHLLPDSWDSSEVRVEADLYHQSQIDSLSSHHNFRFTNLSFIEGDRQQVQHVWYSSWEDFTKPEEEDYPALDYIAALAVDHLAAGKVVAINCFSGRGRTGTFAALVLARYHQLKNHDSLVDLIVSLREHRDGLVEIPAQYRFISEMLRISPPVSSPIPPPSVVKAMDNDSLNSNSNLFRPLLFIVWLVIIPIVLLFRRKK